MRLAVADAELDPVVAVAIVAAALAVEPDDAVIASMSAWSTNSLCGAFLPPGQNRDASAAILAQAAQVLLNSAEPASGRQLAAARAFVASAPETSVLRSWLDGHVPDGVVLDSDLRWVILGRLVARGAAGEDEIDAEGELDKSAQGETQVARLRALLPTEMAKAMAWELLMSSADASNYVLYATAEGFWHPAQTKLTARYVPRYFKEIGETASFRSGWVVQRVAQYAFPWTAVETSTVKRHQEAAGEQDVERQHPPAGHRYRR